MSDAPRVVRLQTEAGLWIHGWELCWGVNTFGARRAGAGGHCQGEEAREPSTAAAAEMGVVTQPSGYQSVPKATLLVRMFTSNPA